MKPKLRHILWMALFIISFMLSACNSQDKPVTAERDRLFNIGWKFIRDSIAGAEQPEYDDAQWRTIDLPHDWSIEDLPGEDGPDQIGPFSKESPGNGNSTGHVIGGTGWYRKSFTLDKADEGKTVILNFDGVYMETTVWVNGMQAGTHKNGYTPFWFDITSLLHDAGTPNIIAVKVDNTGRNSRWYSGSGIYRNVHLIVMQPVHVAVWGTHIKTPEINQNAAVVDVEVTVRNDAEKEIEAQITINIKDQDRNLAGTAKDQISLPGKTDHNIKKQIEVKDPVLWSVESPNLYIAEIVVEVDNKVTDRYNQTFGIRSIEFSAEKGFLLNGKPVDLKGGCMHHDNGLLGSAAFDRAEIRRVELMKANGYNAIRTAHNPPSSAFLDACDRLGMLVIDEFTDMWEDYKNPQDYSRFFREWWKKDLTDMIMRDRNHPGIIMWSIGNEVIGSSDTSGLRIARQLTDCIKALDDTRPVTEAVSEFFIPGGWINTIPVFEIVDVCGYQYNWEKYEPDHQEHPQRIIYASESFPLHAYDSWKAAERSSYVIGDFVWTSMDYLGEVNIGTTNYGPEGQNIISGIPEGFTLPEGINVFDLQVQVPSEWPSFVAGCGDIDITGEKKPQMLYRNIIWDNSMIEINVHAPIPEGYVEYTSMWGWPDERPSWTWPGSEGKILEVRVFTRADHVKLELNGETIGEQDVSADTKYIASFDVPYEPGELKTIAYKDGNEIASKTLTSAGEPVAVRLTADRDRINADRNDLSFVKIEVIDENGQVVPEDSILIRLTLTGDGELAASGNANPDDMGSVNRPEIKTFRGRAQAIIRPFEKGGNITLLAEAEGLQAGQLTIRLK